MRVRVSAHLEDAPRSTRYGIRNTHYALRNTYFVFRIAYSVFRIACHVACGAAFIAVGALLCACAPTEAPEPTLAPRAIRVEYPIVPPDVPMLDQDGQPAALSRFRGRVVLIFFGNIQCRESPCVDALPKFLAIKQALGARSAEVVFIMVGADREADSPAALKQHLAQFDPTFIGLTAERSAMRQLAVRFGIHTSEDETGLLVPHAPFIYLLDRQGRLLYFIQDGVPVGEIVKVVERVLEEPQGLRSPSAALARPWR